MDTQLIVSLSGFDKWVLGIAGGAAGSCLTSMVVMIYKMYSNCIPTIQNNTGETNRILLRMEGYIQAKAEDGKL